MRWGPCCTIVLWVVCGLFKLEGAEAYRAGNPRWGAAAAASSQPSSTALAFTHFQGLSGPFRAFQRVGPKHDEPLPNFVEHCQTLWYFLVPT